MKRLTIKEMQDLASARNGKCISATYENSYTLLEWECELKHRWFALPKAIKQGHWCKTCFDESRKLFIEDMHAHAEKRGGKCLSKSYTNINTKLRWECGEGHRWQSMPNSVQQGRWCPKCGGVEKKTIADMHELAQIRNGRCLSKTYKSMNKPLQWECEKGHRWRAKPNSIQQGSWCLVCAGKSKKTIHEMREIAKERGGQCLSEDYKNSQSLLLWECAKGHKWKARYANISQGQWCPHCAGSMKKTVADMAVLAAEKGGQFLSSEYRGNGTKHKWKCSEGHTWLATPNGVQSGQWCPECSKLLSERLTRVHFESLFGARFPTRKPEWLNNSRGNRMELDGYNEKLHLAFEYHGIQHYRFNPRFHRDENALTRRMRDDRRKKKLCQAHGVSLIEIPYTVQPAQMKDFIVSGCKKAGISIPKKARKTRIDYRKAYLRGSKEKMDRLAAKFSGKCLSQYYVNAHTPLLWECKRGHQWSAKPNYVQQGYWCKDCSVLERRATQKKTMDQLAMNRGGKCLSTAYVNSYTKLEWKCRVEHMWWAVPSEIKRGSWCPECGRKT